MDFYDENKFTNESNLFFEWFLQEDSSLKDKSKQDFNNEFKSFINLLRIFQKYLSTEIIMLTIYFY